MGRRLSAIGRAGRLIPSVIFHDDCFLSVLKLPSVFSRGSLRDTVLSRVRLFVGRLKSSFTFLSHRRHVAMSTMSCCVSLLFCRQKLGHAVTVSLGLKGFGPRCRKRVVLCLHCLGGGSHRRKRRSPVNLVLYSRNGARRVRCLVLSRSDPVGITRCCAGLPSGGLLSRGLRGTVTVTGRRCTRRDGVGRRWSPTPLPALVPPGPFEFAVYPGLSTVMV